MHDCPNASGEPCVQLDPGQKPAKFPKFPAHKSAGNFGKMGKFRTPNPVKCPHGDQ
jgi:hypothetical protein